MYLSIKNSFGSSMMNINQDNQLSKVGNKQTQKEANEQRVIEKQNSSEHILVALSENINDDMEGIRTAFLQCEEYTMNGND